MISLFAPAISGIWSSFLQPVLAAHQIFSTTSTFDTAGPENNSWQVTANGVPTEDGKNSIRWL